MEEVNGGNHCSGASGEEGQSIDTVVSTGLYDVSFVDSFSFSQTRNVAL